MKIAMIGKKYQLGRVYDDVCTDRLKAYGEVVFCLTKRSLERNKEFLSDCEVAFSTWGMLKLTEAEIKEYFPKLKYLFYAAGTVHYFAGPFLNCGVRVFNAAHANGIPVAEYTFAQILLAAKGYFQAAKTYRPLLPYSAFIGRRNCGNYGVTVGLIGLGVIGKSVAEKLKSIDAEVLCYDPFIKKEEADKYGVTLCDVETLFKNSDVISNHLANKKELKNFICGKHFRMMKNNATFINTGRGAQVSEFALAASLWTHPKRTAVCDVIKCENVPFLSPLWWCYNAVLTPHIAGSGGREVTRMAALVIDQFEKIQKGETPSFEVTKENLQTMA